MSAKRVRTYLGGECVADSVRPRLVWENPSYPAYYFPIEDVRVEPDAVVLAESRNAHVLFETGLPARWYVPKVDMRMDLLEPTATVTHCPYKGQAEYWSARVGDRLVPDLAWSYRTTLPESQK